MRPDAVHLERATDAGDARWLALRRRLWPHASDAEHRDEMRTIAARGDCVVLAVAAGGSPVGFAEASRRTDYVNGTAGSPVAFLEGLYVDPAYRRMGVARTLVDAVERWTSAHGLVELASDALVDNAASHAVHRALGFVETERVVYFCKRVRGSVAGNGEETR